jgi:hypothetical protein
MRNVSDKGCREYQNTHFMLSDLFPNVMLFMRRGKFGTAREATDDNI